MIHWPLYLSGHPFFGALVGRYGNRIAKGKIRLNGQEYSLAINNGPNALHGGTKGFDKVLWKATEIKQDSAVGFATGIHQQGQWKKGTPAT